MLCSGAVKRWELGVVTGVGWLQAPPERPTLGRSGLCLGPLPRTLLPTRSTRGALAAFRPPLLTGAAVGLALDSTQVRPPAAEDRLLPGVAPTRTASTPTRFPLRGGLLVVVGRVVKLPPVCRKTATRAANSNKASARALPIKFGHNIPRSAMISEYMMPAHLLNILDSEIGRQNLVEPVHEIGTGGGDRARGRDDVGRGGHHHRRRRGPARRSSRRTSWR